MSCDPARRREVFCINSDYSLCRINCQYDHVACHSSLQHRGVQRQCVRVWRRDRRVLLSQLFTDLPSILVSPDGPTVIDPCIRVLASSPATPFTSQPLGSFFSDVGLGAAELGVVRVCGGGIAALPLLVALLHRVPPPSARAHHTPTMSALHVPQVPRPDLGPRSSLYR